MWPKKADRYFVPDLVPERLAHAGKLRRIYIGESPHRDEVAPEKESERSPFRGMGGRVWWEALGLGRGIVPPRSELLAYCEGLRIAVLNAVQYPIDPKIGLHVSDFDPVRNLGFQKGSGPQGYKAVLKSGGPVVTAIEDLARRLSELSNNPAEVVCLGGDSKWFVDRAWELVPRPSPLTQAEPAMIPHPSSWWRKAEYKKRALEKVKA